jgi:anti-sigma factor ChrR (cupin superfamily)
MTDTLNELTNAADLAKRRVVYRRDTGQCCGSGHAVRTQIFEDFPARSTILVHLAAGTALRADPARTGIEILVVEGQIEIDGIALGTHGYVRRPVEPEPTVIATTDAVLFVKRGHIPAEDRLATLLNPGQSVWQRRQGGQLLTLPLHHNAGIAVSLMRYHPGTAAVVRRRLGGEEILVLDGALLDERSAYPCGTWLRNPPGSLNQPYSLEGCFIYIQTGHLPII